MKNLVVATLFILMLIPSVFAVTNSATINTPSGAVDSSNAAVDIEILTSLPLDEFMGGKAGISLEGSSGNHICQFAYDGSFITECNFLSITHEVELTDQVETGDVVEQIIEVNGVNVTVQSTETFPIYRHSYHIKFSSLEAGIYTIALHLGDSQGGDLMADQSSTLTIAESQQPVVNEAPIVTPTTGGGSTSTNRCARAIWTCTAWVAQSDGSETRSCTISDPKCESRIPSPLLTRNTASATIPLATTPTKETNPSSESNENAGNSITGAVIGALGNKGYLIPIVFIAVIIAGVVYVNMRKKK